PYPARGGAPTRRAGRGRGALRVQTRTPRHYTEDETEVVQTIAMIVAELVASGELVNPLEMAQSRMGASLPLRLDGIRLNPGLAIGPALLHEPKVVIRQVVAEDVEAEHERLRLAVEAMQDAIDRLVDASRRLGPGEHRDIIETYRMFAADRGWLERITEAVRSGLTAEVAIVARAFDIPVVGRVAEATRQIEAGDIVIVDGEHGTVLTRPRADIEQTVAATIAARTRRRAFYETLRDIPAVTRDGIEIKLLLNAGLLLDLAQLRPTGAEGVGLFRTEIPLLTRNAFPDVADQTAFYRRAYEQAEGRPIVFRTLDIGGDKVLPYLAHTAEDNPAMGWRAIRIGLDRPAMLRQQLRALLRAAGGQDLLLKLDR